MMKYNNTINSVKRTLKFTKMVKQREDMRKNREQIKCKTCVVRVGKFTGTKAVKKGRQTQGGSVTDKLRSCFKTL